jgi:hypothetical protein
MHDTCISTRALSPSGRPISFLRDLATLAFAASFRRICSTKKMVVAFSCATVLASFGSQAAEATIAIDTQTSQDQNSASSTVASPVFSTKVGQELLLAFISTDSVTTPNTTVNSVAGAGLTWVKVVGTNGQAGDSEIWRAFAPAALNGASVTAKLSQSVVSSITVVSFTGVITTGTNGSGAIGAISSASESSGAPSASLVTTQSNSLVVGVGNDYDRAILRVPTSGQFSVHQDLSATGDTYWVQREGVPTTLKGYTVNLRDTSPTSDRFNFSICEILSAGTSGAGPTLTTSASGIGFGQVTTGSTATGSLTLSSTGSAPVTVNGASVSGSGFSLESSALPMTLDPGKSLTLQLQFSPKTAGADVGSLAISSNSGNGSTASVSLTGTGITKTDPQLSLNVSSLSFGTLSDGSIATRTVTLTSTGTSTVTVNAESITGASFSLVGGSQKLTLNPNQSATLTVQFAPTTSATDDGTLSVSSNSVQNSTVGVSLTGTGTVPHQVTLGWQAPSGSPIPISGYNVYRTLLGGSLQQINSALDINTSFTDNTVAGGTTYEYEVRSVGVSGVESGPSNETTVSVP